MVRLAKTLAVGRPSRLRPLLLTGLLLSCAAATEALAQELNGTVVLNDQIQTASVRADNHVVVQEATSGLAAGTVAGGNAVSVAVQRQDLLFDSSQRLAAPVHAGSYIQTRYTSGPAFVNLTAATGNSGEAATCCGYLAADVSQVIAPYSPVTARAFSAAGGPVEHVATAATAVGNSQAYASVGGDIGARTGQANYGATGAYNTGIFCCVTGSGSFTATAVSNQMTSAGNDGATYHEVEQLMDGSITEAKVDAYVVTGNNIAGVASAIANTADIYNTGGQAELIARQTNRAAVNADSVVTLDTFYGSGSSIAYGVGNALTLANTGGEPYLDTTQVNSGGVSASASFAGGEGEGDVFTTATAIGNTVSASSCGDCQGSLTVSNRQVNTGAVHSTATTTIGGHAHAVTSISSAIGNSANYEVRSGGH